MFHSLLFGFLFVGNTLIIDTCHINFSGSDLILQKVNIIFSLLQFVLSIFKIFGKQLSSIIQRVLNHDIGTEPQPNLLISIWHGRLRPNIVRKQEVGLNALIITLLTVLHKFDHFLCFLDVG